MIGEKFNRLTITGSAPDKVFPSGKKKQVEALCECGKIGVYVLAALRNGNTKSCGCYNRDRITTHGMNETRQYQCWADMKTRCDNQKHKWFPEYGGRGITYQDSWKSFENFWKDMEEGYSDSLTLDRIENDLGYTKDNCRWAPATQQSHNQRKSYNSTNKYIGVKCSKDGNYIHATIKMDGKPLHLGTHESEEIAAQVYDAASELIYGDRPNKTIDIDGWVWDSVKFRISAKRDGLDMRARGSDFKSAKITEQQALEIYTLSVKGEISQKEIAELYDVNQSTVSSIKRGATWAHVTNNNP